MKSRRPYLLRAMHEWISDNGWTPHIVVDANAGSVNVPRQFVRDGKIILNVGWSATDHLRMGNEEVSFSARFGGTPMPVSAPIMAVLAIYSRETGQGMIFTEDEGVTPPEPQGPESAPSAPAEFGGKPAGGGKPRAKLKVVK